MLLGCSLQLRVLLLPPCILLGWSLLLLSWALLTPTAPHSSLVLLDRTLTLPVLLSVACCYCRCAFHLVAWKWFPPSKQQKGGH